MQKALRAVVGALLSGFLIVTPIYLAVLLILKGMKSVVSLVKPVSLLLPDSVPAETLLSLLLVLLVCFLVGTVVRTRLGGMARERMEKTFFERLPGYALIRSLTQKMAGANSDNVWQPAFFESDEGLLPAFIIEEFDDGRYTIFIPSIPTPLAGAVYVVERRRVHPVDVPFTEALRNISRWGSGSKGLIAAMEKKREAI